MTAAVILGSAMTAAVILGGAVTATVILGIPMMAAVILGSAMTTGLTLGVPRSDFGQWDDRHGDSRGFSEGCVDFRCLHDGL